ncbi:hypothetical protein SEVIR_5G154700v4 [Setaria viridis]
MFGSHGCHRHLPPVLHKTTTMSYIPCRRHHHQQPAATYQLSMPVPGPQAMDNATHYTSCPAPRGSSPSSSSSSLVDSSAHRATHRPCRTKRIADLSMRAASNPSPRGRHTALRLLELTRAQSISAGQHNLLNAVWLMQLLN